MKNFAVPSSPGPSNQPKSFCVPCPIMMIPTMRRSSRSPRETPVCDEEGYGDSPKRDLLRKAMVGAFFRASGVGVRCGPRVFRYPVSPP
ncbi:hypothetical protein GCM10018779_46650 [Streptomyces griseocarneus]|nr:hypothetical protein GCM10018779_46650 [Streptomyces griseocarneus]